MIKLPFLKEGEIFHKPSGIDCNKPSSGDVYPRLGMMVKAVATKEFAEPSIQIRCRVPWEIEASDRFSSYEVRDMDWAEPLGIARYKFDKPKKLSELIDNPTIDFEIEGYQYWWAGERVGVYQTGRQIRTSDNQCCYFHGGVKGGEKRPVSSKNNYAQFYVNKNPITDWGTDEATEESTVAIESAGYERRFAAIGRFQLPVFVPIGFSEQRLNDWLQLGGSFEKLL